MQLEHNRFMKRALQLAQLGLGNASPNPLVGCVVVHNQQIIGEGYHKKYGEAHAEVNAINSVKNEELLKESTVYVTLEPCSHFGKTPPCSLLLIEKQVKRVVICNTDPFKEVNGKGIEALKNAGIEVITGVLAEEGKWVNRRFFTNVLKQRPYVILKWAQTADGFIDSTRTAKETPLQISNPTNKRLVHKWRSEEDAILIGYNTLIKDNPSLTVREIAGNNPISIVILNGNKSADLSKFKVANNDATTLIYSNSKTLISNKTNNEVVEFTNLNSMLGDIAKRGVGSIIIEGGKKTLQQFLDTDLWDEARVTSSNQQILNGVSAPNFNGKLKDQFTCGKSNVVSIFSPAE